MSSAWSGEEHVRQKERERRRENGRVRNKDDNLHFCSLSLSLIMPQCQRDFTAKNYPLLSYAIIRYRRDVCDRVEHTTHKHTQTHTSSNQSDKNKQPRKLKAETGGEAGEQEVEGIMK